MGGGRGQARGRSVVWALCCLPQDWGICWHRVGLGGSLAAALCSVRKLYSYCGKLGGREAQSGQGIPERTSPRPRTSRAEVPRTPEGCPRHVPTYRRRGLCTCVHGGGGTPLVLRGGWLVCDDWTLAHRSPGDVSPQQQLASQAVCRALPPPGRRCPLLPLREESRGWGGTALGSTAALARQAGCSLQAWGAPRGLPPAHAPVPSSLSSWDPFVGSDESLGQGGTSGVDLGPA